MQIQFQFVAPWGQAASHARRALVLVGLGLLVLHADPARAFGFDDVAALAKLQAQGTYRSVSRKPPAELQALTYDQYLSLIHI